MIPSSITEIIGQLSDAVTASGKKISEIGKEPILHYLEKIGTPKQYWNEIYEKLRGIHDPVAGSHGTSGPGGNYAPTTPPLDKEKHREPRKSVFGQIKKIAG
jgi:hypothetical protein